MRNQRWLVLCGIIQGRLFDYLLFHKMSKSFWIWKWMTERSILDFRVKVSPYFGASIQTSWHYVSLAFLFRIINGYFFPFVAEMSGIFCNFIRILSFSLYKGSLEDWGKSGLRIGNRTQFHILLWNAFNEHPMLSHQPYYGSSSGAKVTISFEKAKSIHIFFFRACSTLLNWLRHLLWHLPEKCVLGYVPLP